MKAVICTTYGSPEVLEIVEVQKPAPGPDEVLVRVHAAAVTTADTMMRSGSPAFTRLFLGLKRPKNPLIGTGFAGVVEAVGPDVTGFRAGDRVFGETGMRFGANADYVCVPQTGVIAPIPDALTFEQAAPLTDGALTSLNFLREVAGLKPGQRVLINGASGGLGTAAVQIAKALGAEVTGVCSGRNAELVLSLGADRVIDYAQQDFTRSGDTYDVIYDTIGKSSFVRSKAALTESGVYLSPVLRPGLLSQMLLTARTSGRKARFSATGLRPEPELRALLRDLVAMIDKGKLVTVLDRTYPLDQTREAHRYVETGRKRGNVVVTPSLTDVA